MQKKILCTLALYLVILNSNIASFNSLKEIQQYAKQYPEFPPANNIDWEDPDYTAFHKSISPSFFDKTRRSLGLPIKEQWSAQQFKKLLLDVITQQKETRNNGRFVSKIACDNNTQFFIWQNLQGSFHSLARGLSWLAEQKIIDNSLSIKQDNTFLVFNGDLISRTAYALETLSVVLLLLKNNPTRVIYIMGKHEDKNYWTGYALKRELILKAAHIDSQKIPLKNEISEFFSNLPLALYLYAIPDQHTVIRISHRTREDKEINEAMMNGFFDSIIPNGSISYYNITQETPTPLEITICSIVTTEEWRRENRASTKDEYGYGLGFLNQDQGSTAWSILSSPTPANKEFFNFYYDAFAQIITYIPIQKTTINLYNRDIRTSNQFEKSKIYNIVTGFSKNLDAIPRIAIKLGSSMSLVQGVPTMGQDIRRGFLTKINQQNRMGGIHGKMIQAIVYNDDYTPLLTRKNIDRLINQDKAELIMLSIGTPTINTVADRIKNNDLTVLFPVTGNHLFRDKQFKGFIHLRASYADEVRAIIDHLLTKTTIRKFTFFYQDDTYGINPLNIAHEELKRRGITDWVDVPYQRNSINFKSQAEKIKQSLPDAIGLFSTANATRDLLREIGMQFLINKFLFGISFLGENQFRDFLKESGLTVLFGAVVPNPRTSNLEIVKEYRKAMDEYQYPYNVFSLEAYIAASLLIDVMEKIEGPITRQTITQKLESLKDYDFKGLKLSFDPERKSLLNNIWIETGDTVEWIEKTIPKNTTNGVDTNITGTNISTIADTNTTSTHIIKKRE